MTTFRVRPPAHQTSSLAQFPKHTKLPPRKWEWLNCPISHTHQISSKTKTSTHQTSSIKKQLQCNGGSLVCVSFDLGGTLVCVRNWTFKSSSFSWRKFGVLRKLCQGGSFVCRGPNSKNRHNSWRNKFLAIKKKIPEITVKGSLFWDQLEKY